MEEERPEETAIDLRWKDIAFSLFGLWWLISAIVGAPSLLTVIDSIFINFKPGLLLEAILESYRELRKYIAFATDPLIRYLGRISEFFPFLGRSPAEYWIDVFVIFSVWASAIAKIGRRFYSLHTCILAFLVLEFTFFLSSSLGTMVNFENVIVREVSISVVPIFILCFFAIFIRVILSTVKSFAGTYFMSIFMLMWIPFGVALIVLPGILIGIYIANFDTGVGLMSLFIMAFVISGGAAVDAKNSGDRESAEFYLTVLGPFLGLWVLWMADAVAEIVITHSSI